MSSKKVSVLIYHHSWYNRHKLQWTNSGTLSGLDCTFL